MKSKLIRFEYFLLSEIVNNNTTNTVTPTPANLSQTLSNLQQIPVMDRRIIRNDEAIVLVGIEARRRQRRRENYDYWSLQFVRIRETMLPSIIDENGSCREMVLQNNEDVAEFTNVLYDNNNSVMLTQRSQEGVLPRYIAEFFSNFHVNNEIQASIILSPNDLSQLRNGTIVRRIEFSAASCIDSLDPSVSAVAAAARGVGARFFDTTLRLGISSRDNTMFLSGIRNLISSLLHNTDVSQLKIAAKLPESSKVEYYDLIEQRRDEKAVFTFSRENPITNLRIFNAIEGRYFDSLNNINQYIRR